MDYKKTKDSTISLKAKIKGFEIMARDLMKQVRKHSGDERALLRCKKKILGDETRYHLAAYALLRNVPFYVVENTTSENYCPLSAKRVLSILLHHEPFRFVENRCKPWSVEEVNERLSVKSPVIDNAILEWQNSLNDRVAGMNSLLVSENAQER